MLLLSEVVSFKVPREVKEKMKALKNKINWSEELRKYVVKRIEEMEREEALEKALKLLESVKPAKRGTAAKYVRESRDSN